MFLPLYFNTDCRYTNEVSVYKLCLLGRKEDFPLRKLARTAKDSPQKGGESSPQVTERGPARQIYLPIGEELPARTGMKGVMNPFLRVAAPCICFVP